MEKKAPGKHFRDGITLIQLFEKFPDDETAEKWFVECRWPDDVHCAYCKGENIINAKHPTMPYRCRDCGKHFSVKTKSVMHGSNIGYRKWSIAIYLIITSLKGVSSMKLHRDLGITQKSAWHMTHRIRKAWDSTNDIFASEVEADETYMGGKEYYKHASKKLHAGRRTVGKTTVVGMKGRETNQVNAEMVGHADKETLQGFVSENTSVGATVYTDEARAYSGLARKHESVKHSVGEYVNEQVHTNGIESFWSMLKRGHKGTYHKMSPIHLHRYVDEFSGRHNQRPMDSEEQMADVVKEGVDKQPRYRDLIT